MQIWLDQVRDEPFNWDETQSVSPQALDRYELLALSPVHWRGQVVFADPGFFLRARLSYEQTLSCNRCLKPIVEQAKSDVELMILVEHGPEAGGEHALHEQDLGLIYLQDELLETDPILIEQLQLNIPMKPLCREDCRGLCPVCGVNRNLVACACPERAPDPRLVVLKDLATRLHHDER